MVLTFHISVTVPNTGAVSPNYILTDEFCHWRHTSMMSASFPVFKQNIHP